MADTVSKATVKRWLNSIGVYGYESKVDALPVIKAELSWIPVTERLPEHKKTRYWVCTDTGYQCECRWTDNRFGMGNLSGEWGWSIFDTPQYSKVVAWMSLPEPYKIDEVEE